MSSFKQGMFRRIHNSDKKRILVSLGEHRVPLSVKGDKDEVFNMITDSLEGEYHLGCKVILGSKRPAGDQPVVVNFTFGYERYFFQAFMTTGSEIVIIEASADFYILQRRKSARLELPDEYPRGFNMIEHRGKPAFYEFKVIDFSSGGLKVHYPLCEPEFQTGEKVKGVLHLGSRRPINMEALIRHVIRKDAGPKAGQTFGLQFDPINKIMELKLLTIFMDLQREVFLKYSK